MTQHDVRIKCEPSFNSQNPSAFASKPVTFLKQEKPTGDSPQGYRPSQFPSQRQLQHSVSQMSCDKNGNNLLMIAPSGLNMAGSTPKQNPTATPITSPNPFPSGSANAGNLIRSPVSSRSSGFPKSPQISVQPVVGTTSSPTVPLANGSPSVATGGSSCGQKRLKVEREEDEPSAGCAKECRGPLPPVHSVPVRKRVKVTFVKDSNTVFRSDFRASERK